MISEATSNSKNVWYILNLWVFFPNVSFGLVWFWKGFPPGSWGKFYSSTLSPQHPHVSPCHPVWATASANLTQSCEISILHYSAILPQLWATLFLTIFLHYCQSSQIFPFHFRIYTLWRMKSSHIPLDQYQLSAVQQAFL